MKIPVLDKGHVELLSCPDDDLTIVNAARVSFGKESKWEYEYPEGEQHHVGNQTKRLSDRDTKLIQYLAKNHHWTPFAHPQIRLRIKWPIFVARQAMRSNVGVVWNEVSRRYLDGEDLPLEFYEPKEWRGRPEKGIKQGSGEAVRYHPSCYGWVDFEQEGEEDWEYVEFIVSKEYQRRLLAGVAPEMARMILPQSLYTECWATGSLYFWSRLYRQRSEPHAQWEIQEFARAVDQIIAPRFPVGWKALTEQ